MLLLFFLLQILILTPGEPLTLNMGTGPQVVMYEAAGTETVTISARSLADEAIDVTLEVLDGADRLAFNDDHFTDRNDLQPTDAVIAALTLPGAGRYTIRVNSFNGVQAGPVEIRLDVVPVAACDAGLTVRLRRGGVFTCALETEPGAALTLTARDSGGTLDPVLSLLDASGAVVAHNDDHGSARTDLNTLDAQISRHAAMVAGVYTVQVTDFSGAAGTFTLSIRVEP